MKLLNERERDTGRQYWRIDSLAPFRSLHRAEKGVSRTVDLTNIHRIHCRWRADQERPEISSRRTLYFTYTRFKDDAVGKGRENSYLSTPLLPARPFSKMAQDLEEKREEAGSPFVTPFPFFFFDEGNDLESPRGGYQGHKVFAFFLPSNGSLFRGNVFRTFFSFSLQTKMAASPSRYHLVRPREAGERPVQIKIQHGSCALWTLICTAL